MGLEVRVLIRNCGSGAGENGTHRRPKFYPYGGFFRAGMYEMKNVGGFVNFSRSFGRSRFGDEIDSAHHKNS